MYSFPRITCPPAAIEKAKAMGAAGYIVKASAIPSEVLTETLKIIGAPLPADSTPPAA